MKPTLQKSLIVIALLGLSLSPSAWALAQGTSSPIDDNVLDNIIKLYRETAFNWREPILSAATRLFWILVTIDFTWMGITLGLQRADFSRIVSELIRRFMFIGFYYALLLNSGTWSQSIVDSFRDLAGAASSSRGLSGGITPSNIFDLGLRVIGDLGDKVTFSEIGESIARILVSIAILISFSLISGYLLISLIEVYISINATLILLGLGGSRWTHDYANKYLIGIFSSGIKIFVMQLLIGVGQSFILELNTRFAGNLTHSMVLFGVSVVLCLLVKTIPDHVQAIVAGVTPQSAGNAFLGAAASGVAASGAAMASSGGTAVGGASAVMEALRRTKADGAGSAAGFVMNTAKHLGRAAMEDISGRMSGDASHRYGTTGGRMASKLKEERMRMSQERGQKEEPNGTKP